MTVNFTERRLSRNFICVQLQSKPNLVSLEVGADCL